MASSRASTEPVGARWSCRRCYTVNAPGAQFCSDCGLTPRPAQIEAAAPSIGPARRRIVALRLTFLAAIALGFAALQLPR